jgi:F-type H+-transporting ATPase subunit gamma
MPPLQSIRTIGRKIRSVNNIKKITRAMEMVSAAKLKKVQERLFQLRPYANNIKELLEELATRVTEIKHPLFLSREKTNSIAIVLITSDKGLCGAFNSNMLRTTSNFLKERKIQVKLITIGKKGTEFFKKQGVEPISSYTGIPTEVPFERVKRITLEFTNLFESGGVDEVYITYSEYINALVFKPRIIKFLPIEKEKILKRDRGLLYEYIFEPEVPLILERLIPRYVQTTFHRILLESFSSEHSARMNAMRNATENAEELIESLTLTYNKARQAGITKELLDIVSGAEALK